MNDKIQSKKQGSVNQNKSLRISKKPKKTQTALLHDNEELTILNRLAQKVTVQLSIQRACKVAVKELSIALGLDVAVLFLQEGDELRLAAGPTSSYLRPESVNLHRVGECLCGLAARNGRPVFSNDIQKDKRCTWTECKKAGLCSFAAIPLRTGNKPVGIIGIGSVEERDFKQASRFLKTAANQIAIGIQNAKQFEKIQGYSELLKQQITERKQAEKRISKEYEFNRLIISNAGEGISVCQAVGEFPFVKFTVWNQRMTDMTGYSIDDINRLGWYQSMYPDPAVQERAIARMQRMRVGDNLQSEEWEITRADGHKRQVLITTRLLTSPDAPQQVLAVLNDITERKQAEEKITMLSSVVEQSTEGMAIADLDGNLIFINKAWCRMHSYNNPEELFDQNLAISHNREQLEKEVKPFNEKVMKLGAYSGEVGHITKDGKVFSTLMTTTLLKDEQGNPYALAGIAKEITELKLAEEALKESEERYRRITESITDYIYTVKVEKDKAVETVHGESCVVITGYSAEEFAGDSYLWIRMVVPEDRARVEEQARRILAKEEAYAIEHRIIKKDGMQRWIRNTVVPRYTDQGELISYDGLIKDITERKKAEEILQKNRSDLLVILDNLPFLAWLKDSEGRFIAVNVPFAHASGHSSPEDLIGKTDLDIWPKHLAESYRADDNTVMWSGQKKSVEEVISDHGVDRWFETYKAPLFDVNGKVTGTTGFARDITERKQSETALRESEARQKYILESVQAGIMLIDAETHVITDVNPVAAHMIGSSRKQLIGSICNKHVCPAEVGKCPITDLGHKIDNSDKILITANGKRLSILKTVVPVTIHGRKHLLESFIDITERKQAEKEHLLNETRISSLLKLSRMTDQADQDLTDFTLEKAIELTGSTIGYLAFMNEDETVLSMYSWSKQAMKECLIESKPLVYPVETTGLWGEAVRQRQPIITNDYLAPNPVKKGYPEGHVHVRRHMNIPLFDGDRIVLVAGVGNKEEPYGDPDIKQLTLLMDGMWKIIKQRRAEEELRKSEEAIYESYSAQSLINILLSESLENIPLEEFLQKALNMILSIPWIAFEAIGSISLVEDKADALMMKAQSNIPEPLKELCTQVPFGQCLCGKAAQTQKIEFADHIDERHETCYEGMVPHGHYSVPILSGGRTLGVITIYLKEGHVRNQKEEELLNSVANTLSGIIMRKKAEEEKEKLHDQLLQAQKMEAVGQLAGGIAHDFNNILTAIIGYGNLSKMEIEKDSTLSTYMKYILDSAGRATNLTQDLLAFSRKQIISPKPINVNEVIKGAEKILLRLIGADIELSTHFSDKDLIVMADSTQMEHVLMNLATNARDAMPKGGDLLIRSDFTEIDERFIHMYGYGEKGKYAVITVSDTGEGIDEQTKDKIFEPFFTTKAVGKGTGLGLAMVYGIVKQHNGFINVYSEPGKGTTFKIYLPLIHAKIIETKEIELPISKGGTETILVAEDDAMVRKFMREVIEGAGYTVIEAKDGEDAIDVFIENKDRIQLLILDVIMPKKNGKEVYETINGSFPLIKAIFTSGYSADILHKKGIISEGPEVILKPVSSDNLLKKIRDLLDQ